eukprot:1760656-Prymnesium_polylepis.1
MSARYTDAASARLCVAKRTTAGSLSSSQLLIVPKRPKTRCTRAVRIIAASTPALRPKRHRAPSYSSGRGGISFSCRTVVPTALAKTSAITSRARPTACSSSFVLAPWCREAKSQKMPSMCGCAASARRTTSSRSPAGSGSPADSQPYVSAPTLRLHRLISTTASS